MNVMQGFGLYILGAFTLVVLALFDIIPTNYLGGFVIAGFIGGLLFALLNAWRQGEKMTKSIAKASPQTEVNLSESVSTFDEQRDYPCMKEIMTGTRQGDTCVYSAGCELAPVCSSLKATT